MTLTACLLCHHEALRTRWIGGLRATYCELCGCLYLSEPASAEGVSTRIPPSGTAHAPRSSGPAVPAPVAPLPRAVT